MHDSKTNIEDRMAVLKSCIKLNSLTTEEIFIGQAMKNNHYHQKAKQLLTNKMKLIIEGHNPNIREVNISGFIDSINDDMIRADVDDNFAEMGVMSTRQKGQVKKLTPEEIAASEVE